MSYRIDHGAVKAFARELGIEQEVVIRRARTIYRHGSHTATVRGMRGAPPVSIRHAVMIDHWSGYGAAGTLAHELWHALQCEHEILKARDAAAWGDRTRRERVLPWAERPIEREAEAAKELFRQWIYDHCITEVLS